MNFQSCLCVTPWVWICFFWIEGTLYEIATQIYCQDKILELFWQHWKLEIIQISICQEDNLQCTLSVTMHPLWVLCKLTFFYHCQIFKLRCFQGLDQTHIDILKSVSPPSLHNDWTVTVRNRSRLNETFLTLISGMLSLPLVARMPDARGW